MSYSDWIDVRQDLPPAGQEVLTYGSKGYVVAFREPDGAWQAKDVDYETGEPWLKDPEGSPSHWAPLSPPPVTETVTESEFTR